MNKVNHLEFNDGIVKLYSVKNAADEGDTPVEKLVLIRSCRFKCRTVGMTRYYEAMQHQIRLAKMILIPECHVLNVLDVAVLSDGATQYRIEQVQRRTDTRPFTMQLSLSAIESGDEYEVNENDT